MKLKKAILGFSALSQESRLQVFRLLLERLPDGLPAGTISEILKIPPTTLSFHLSQLTTARLIEARKEGRSIIYTANIKRARKLGNFISKKAEIKENELLSGSDEDTDASI